MYIKEIEKLPRRIQQVLDMNPDIPKLAAKYYVSENAFVILDSFWFVF